MAIPAGADLDAETLNDEFDRHARGMVAWGHRETASTTTTNSTGVGVLRLDDISVEGGRAYRIFTDPLAVFSTVSGDDVGVKIHYTTDGSTPTTSSARMPGPSSQDRQFGTSIGNFMTLDTVYQPEDDELLSLLLCVFRLAGTGSVNIFASATFPVDLYVEDKGLAVADTGVDV